MPPFSKVCNRDLWGITHKEQRPGGHMSDTSNQSGPGLGRERVAQALGIAPDRARWRLIKSAAAREVFLLEGTDCDPLVVKYDDDVSQVRFGELLSCYRSLERVMGRDGAFRMVPLVWADAENRVLALKYVPGLTAYARLEAAEIDFDSRADVLRHCGAWLRQLHQSASDTPQPFDGEGMLKRVRRVAKTIRSGSQEVAYPKKFLGICAFMHHVKRGAQGRPCRHGARHGDFHSRNVVFGRDGPLYALDPAPRDTGPVAFDVARFMTRLGYSFGLARTQPRGLAGLPAADWVALSAGYGHPCQDDPVVHFLLCHQLFNDWLQMPVEKEHRSASQQRRIERIVSMFEVLRQQLQT